MSSKRIAITPQKNDRLGVIFSRYYWLQIALIALSIFIGLACSAWVIKGSLLKTALEQEMAHYWTRLDRDANANLPDTKNLYGYRWTTTMPPEQFRNLSLTSGVHRIYVDGKERMTVYGERGDQHVLLVFGESNVNQLVWIFGLAPLMLSLFVLYSFLWWSNRRAKRYFSPITRLAHTLDDIDLENINWAKQSTHTSPFHEIQTNNNIEAADLKQALEKYHLMLSRMILREREFISDVSHELRTPLTVLKGNVQLSQAKFGSDRAMTAIENTIDDMQVLVDTLLAISRNKSSQLSYQSLYLSQIVQSLIADLDHVSTFKSIAIKYQLDGQEQQRKLHSAMTKMVFSNILRNALNYSQGTQVDVIQRDKMIIIADDGIGIVDQNDSNSPQINRSLAQSAKGHGIGLLLVDKLCKQLGWRVELFDRDRFLAQHQDLSLQHSRGLVVVIYFT